MTNTTTTARRLTKAQRREINAISAKVGETPTSKVQCTRSTQGFVAGQTYGAHGFTTGQVRIWDANGKADNYAFCSGAFRFVQEGR